MYSYINLRNLKELHACIGCAKENLSSNNLDYSLCNSTSSMYRMAETKDGFYFIHDKLVYYADKSNMNEFVPVCNKPDCQHSGANMNCNANCFGDGLIQKNGKLYGCEILGVEIGKVYPNPYVFEFDMNGNGIKVVYDIFQEEQRVLKFSRTISQDNIVVCSEYLTEYGMYENSYIRLKEENV